MKTKIKYPLIIAVVYVVFFLLFNFKTSAADKGKFHISGDSILVSQQFELSLGGGAYSAFKGTSGFGLNASVSVYQNKAFYSLRLVRNNEFTILISPAEKFTEAGMLFGGAAKNKKLALSGAVGIGLVDGIKRTEEKIYTSGFGQKYKSKSYTDIAFLAEINLNVNLSHYFGLGLKSVCDFNADNSFFAILFCCRVGLIK